MLLTEQKLRRFVIGTLVNDLLRVIKDRGH